MGVSEDGLCNAGIKATVSAMTVYSEYQQSQDSEDLDVLRIVNHLHTVFQMQVRPNQWLFRMP